MFCSWLHDTWASRAKSNKSVQTLQKKTLPEKLQRSIYQLVV